MPLRASKLPQLGRCTFSAVVATLSDDGSGEAADTGTAAHRAIKEWHKDKDSQRAIREMRKAVAEFPLANLDTAESHFQAYAKDPRNKEAEVIQCDEGKDTLVLQADKNDPTGAPIVIRGTLDQIRVENGLAYVWDVKTGKAYYGFDMLHHYALQLAAYQLMASQTHANVVGSGIIRTQDYFMRSPGPVFWSAPWTTADCERLLDTVRLKVAEVRRKRITLTPDAKTCDYCPMRCLSNCLPLHREHSP